ncbi:MAG: hypothetical protein ACE149_02490 [Armatimonadota bacterium]
MSLASLRPRAQLGLAVVIPLLCLPIGLYLVWRPVNDLRRVTQEIDVTQQAVEQKSELIRQAEEAAQGRPLALAVAKPEETEPIGFLREFNRLIAESGAKLASVQGTKLPPVPVPGAPPPPPPQSGAPATATEAAPPPPPTLGGQRPVLPATVNEISDKVTVEGDFGSVLALMLRLETYSRILSISQLQLHEGRADEEGQVKATFTLSRYTARETTPVAAQPAPASGAAGAGPR